MLKIATVPTTAFAQNTRIIADEDKHTAVVSDPGGNAAAEKKVTILKRKEMQKPVTDRAMRHVRSFCISFLFSFSNFPFPFVLPYFLPVFSDGFLCLTSFPAPPPHSLSA